MPWNALSGSCAGWFAGSDATPLVGPGSEAEASDMGGDDAVATEALLSDCHE